MSDKLTILYRFLTITLVWLGVLRGVSGADFSQSDEQIGLPPEYDIDSPDLQTVFQVGYLEDTTGVWDIAQVAERRVSETSPSRFTVPSARSVHWFSFTLTNHSAQHALRMVSFDEVYMERASIYWEEDGEWQESHSGLSVKIADRAIQNRAPVFLIELPPNSSKTIYLRLHSRFILALGIFIQKPEQFLQAEQVRIIGYWFFFGAAIVIFLYNLFLLISLKQRVYLFYCAYSLSFILFSFLYSGFSLYVVQWPWLHYDLHFSIALTGAFIAFFTRELLQTKTAAPKLDSVVRGIGFWYILLAILIVINIEFYLFLVVSGMPTMLVFFVAGVYLLRQKNELARFYVLAMTGYLLGLSMIALVNLGAVPYNFLTRYGYLLGSLVEMIVFSLALAYRFKLLESEKSRVQGQLLNIEQQSKERLEVDVARRTEELEAANLEVGRQRDELQLRNENIETLLKEIHHRVKNNLQVVSSLLELQSRDIADEGALSTFMEGQNRVKAMALIHQELYQKDDLASIDFDQYARKLISELDGLYAKQKRILFSVRSGANAHFDIDTAVPLGLILNELISNAFKYAFPDREQGEIMVSIQEVEKGKHELVVADSGIGLPEEFDFKSTKTLGLRLVRRLAKQLYGSVLYAHEKGAKFTISFSETALRRAT